MMDIRMIMVILGSGFLGSIGTSFYNKSNNDMNNKLKYIIVFYEPYYTGNII